MTLYINFSYHVHFCSSANILISAISVLFKINYTSNVYEVSCLSEHNILRNHEAFVQMKNDLLFMFLMTIIIVLLYCEDLRLQPHYLLFN